MKISFHPHLLLIFLFFLRFCEASEVDGVDPRSRTISKVEWQKKVTATKIESPKNALLLGQAYNSKLAELAFNYYEKFQKGQPKNPYAALYYGQAGRLYFEELLPLASDPTGKQDKAIRAANENMKFAVKKLPKSAYAHMVYGYFLWQFYDQIDEGLAMVRKARQLDPKAANIASTLGLMYRNQYGHCYDLAQAERAYKTAIQLDPQYASARYGLSSVLQERGKYAEALKQLQVALSLSPKKTKEHPGIIQQLKLLNKKISR